MARIWSRELFFSKFEIFYQLIIEKFYVYNIFTTLSLQVLDSKLLQVFNLNSLLKLFFFPVTIATYHLRFVMNIAFLVKPLALDKNKIIIKIVQCFYPTWIA